MGTEVNNAETYELRHSPGRRVTSLTLFYKVPSTLYVVRHLAYEGLYYPSEGFSLPTSDWAPADTIGLRGYLFYRS